MNNHVTILALVGIITLTPLRGEERVQSLSTNFAELATQEASNRGESDATHDINNGLYKIMVYGMPHALTKKEMELEQKGVRYVILAACIVSRETIAYADGYNAKMMPFLIRKFGKDIFRKGKYERAN